MLAAFITWLLNLKYKRDILDSLIILLIVIVVFYIISTIAIKLFDKIRNMDSSRVINVTGEDMSKETDEEKDEDEK